MDTLQIGAESHWLWHAGAAIILYLHIAGGSIGIVAGAAALAVRKGRRLHAIAGNIFFVSMMVMAAIGAFVAPFLASAQGDPKRFDSIIAFFTCYLVATSWVTVRRKAGTIGAFEKGAFAFAALLAAAAFLFGARAAGDPDGLVGGFPAQGYYVLGGLDRAGGRARPQDDPERRSHRRAAHRPASVADVRGAVHRDRLALLRPAGRPAPGVARRAAPAPHPRLRPARPDALLARADPLREGDRPAEAARLRPAGPAERLKGAMLNRLFPRQVDNRFDGHRAALWLLGLLIALKLAMSLNSIVNTASVAAGADGIPLASFGPAAARQVLLLFALMALGQLTLTLIALAALIRYRALVPFIYLVLLGEHIARRVIVQSYTAAGRREHHYRLIVNYGAPDPADARPGAVAHSRPAARFEHEEI